MLGYLSENPKAFIFLMDYVNRQCIKVWGRAEEIEGNAELNERLSDPEHTGKVDRSLLFHVEAWDVNCHQHIHRRLGPVQICRFRYAVKSRSPTAKRTIDLPLTAAAFFSAIHSGLCVLK